MLARPPSPARLRRRRLSARAAAGCPRAPPAAIGRPLAPLPPVRPHRRRPSARAPGRHRPSARVAAARPPAPRPPVRLPATSTPPAARSTQPALPLTMAGA